MPGDEDEADSDAEWKDIRARAASRQAAKPGGAQRKGGRQGRRVAGGGLTRGPWPVLGERPGRGGLALLWHERAFWPVPGGPSSSKAQIIAMPALCCAALRQQSSGGSRGGWVMWTRSGSGRRRPSLTRWAGGGGSAGRRVEPLPGWAAVAGRRLGLALKLQHCIRRSWAQAQCEIGGPAEAGRRKQPGAAATGAALCWAALQGEDWEHEDVAADDDLDMGEAEDDAAAEVSPIRRWGGVLFCRQAPRPRFLQMDNSTGLCLACGGWPAGAPALQLGRCTFLHAASAPVAGQPMKVGCWGAIPSQGPGRRRREQR